MNTNDIVLALNAEISRLQQVKALLIDTSSSHPCKAQTRPIRRRVWERQGYQPQTGRI
jgi:hypothetical protein